MSLSGVVRPPPNGSGHGNKAPERDRITAPSQPLTVACRSGKTPQLGPAGATDSLELTGETFISLLIALLLVLAAFVGVSASVNIIHAGRQTRFPRWRWAHFQFLSVASKSEMWKINGADQSDGLKTRSKERLAVGNQRTRNFDGRPHTQLQLGS